MLDRQNVNKSVFVVGVGGPAAKSVLVCDAFAYGLRECGVVGRVDNFLGVGGKDQFFVCFLQQGVEVFLVSASDIGYCYDVRTNDVTEFLHLSSPGDSGLDDGESGVFLQEAKGEGNSDL